MSRIAKQAGHVRFYVCVVAPVFLSFCFVRLWSGLTLCLLVFPFLPPTQVKGALQGAAIIGIASGDCHTLALDLSGRVYGWGCFKDKVLVELLLLFLL